MLHFQTTGDARRFLSWKFAGGQRFFSQYWRDLVSCHKWVFIVGCNNSGTSILQRILKNSGQVSTWKLEGQRYTRAMPRAMRRGYERVWMEYADDLRMPLGSEQAVAPRLVHDWLVSLDAPVKKVVLEKTPANLLRMEWLRSVFPDSYFIGLVRNGYAVSEGIRRKSYKDIGRAASHWAAANAAMIETAENIDRYIEVRYEDFFDKEPETIARLAEFLDLDRNALSSAMTHKYALRTIEGEGEQSLKNMNPVSFQRLNAQDIEIIRACAGDMLDRFGYRPD